MSCNYCIRELQGKISTLTARINTNGDDLEVVIKSSRARKLTKAESEVKRMTAPIVKILSTQSTSREGNAQATVNEKGNINKQRMLGSERLPTTKIQASEPTFITFVQYLILMLTSIIFHM